MPNKEKEIEKILEIIDTELSKKEQAYLLWWRLLGNWWRYTRIWIWRRTRYN